MTIGSFAKTPLEPEQKKKFQEEIVRTATHMADYFLKDQPFIGGQDISIADIQAICELSQLEIIGEDVQFKSNPKVAAWYDRVKDTLQPHFDESMKDLGGLKAMYDEAANK